MPRLLHIVPLLLLAGCSHTYRVSRASGGTAPPFTVGPTARLYVAVPEDARFHDVIYHNSGRRVASALAAALRKHASTVIVGASVQDRAAALDSAQRARCDYAVVPEIVHWPGHTTTSTDPSDEVDVRITIVDVASHQPVDSADVSARSRRLIFRAADPQSLLPAPIGEYVDGLFGALPER
jgi:hypothetical protein